MTGKDAQQYNIAAIRQLLLAAFTPEELRRFCYDRPTFRPIVALFGSGHGLVDMVDRVVEYCDRHVLLDQLLAEVKQTNPGQYAQFESALLVTSLEKPPAETVPKPTPQKPSIARPPAKAIETPRRDEPSQPTPELALSASDRDILTITNPIHLELVLVPAGEFLMGSDKAKDKDAGDDEHPLHRVHVPEFYIGKYPVTNAQYQGFVQATEHRMPGHWQEGKTPNGKEDHPVALVTWHDAVAFCTWLSRETGEPFRLPTEAEWEKAARGTDGRIYPWGDDPPNFLRCDFANNLGDTTPVGAYSPQGDSPYGCADMAGNVWEWCQSLYVPYPYRVDDGRESLLIGGDRVFRGGAFHCEAQVVRCAFRLGFSSLPVRYYYFGFRIARGPLP